MVAFTCSLTLLWRIISPQWIANAVVVGLSFWMLVNAGSSITIGILALCSGLMFQYTYKYVPETKGKTLDEIEELWRK